MRLFPLFADLKGREVLVVGGGQVAERKVKALLQAGALVTVGAPDFEPEIRQLARDGRVTLIEALFDPAWLDGKWLVIAATDDRSVNAAVSDAASARRMLANVVDDPELSSFQVPSIVDRAPLVIAISSGGAAPVLARRLRERIESLFDHSLGALARLAHQYRQDIRRQHADMGARRRFYDWMFDGPVAALLREGKTDQAEAVLAQALQQEQPALPGRLIFVGTGPGPASLLTLQGLRALNEADVIVHEEGVGEEVLALARRDADIVKWREPSADQLRNDSELMEQLMARAEQGRCVVHLHPGDAWRPAMSDLSPPVGQAIAIEWVPGVPLHS